MTPTGCNMLYNARLCSTFYENCGKMQNTTNSIRRQDWTPLNYHFLSLYFVYLYLRELFKVTEWLIKLFIVCEDKRKSEGNFITQFRLFTMQHGDLISLILLLTRHCDAKLWCKFAINAKVKSDVGNWIELFSYRYK